MAANVNIYKIVLAGDGGVGKTTYLQSLMGTGYGQVYNPTLGVEVNPWMFNNNTKFNFWDTAGQERFAGLSDGYYIKMNAAMIFFDLTKESSFTNIPVWANKLYRVNENVPIVVCGMKSDLENRFATEEEIEEKLGGLNNVWYVEVSAKNGTNIRNPLQILTNYLDGNNSVKAAR